MACWGLDATGAASPPPGTFLQISGARTHTCGVKTDHTLACWGQPETGPFGSTDHGQANPPPGEFIQVDAFDYHTCGVRLDQTVACWGNNLYGQADPLPGEFLQVSVGREASCGLRIDHSLACWGALGDNAGHLTTPPAGEFASVDVGADHACALGFDQQVVCWGREKNGELSLPAGDYTSMSAGVMLTCGVRADGPLVCRGYNGPSGVDYGATDTLLGPFTAVSAGSGFKCGLRPDGTISCSGLNDYYQAPDVDVTLETVATTAVRPAGEAAPSGATLHFVAAGGTPPYTFQILSGALPAGLTLNPDGTVGGTTAQTTPQFATVQATGADQLSGVAFFWFNAHTTYLPRLGLP